MVHMAPAGAPGHLPVPRLPANAPGTCRCSEEVGAVEGDDDDCVEGRVQEVGAVEGDDDDCVEGRE